MTTRHHILLLAALLGVCASARGQGKVSCAVIADKDIAARCSALAWLLEAHLSQDERIQLLERTQIQKLLDEHQTTLSGLMDRDGTIKAGQLLRAQAFVLLSTENMPGQSREPNGVLIRVRVAETAHGLRLWEGYESWEPSGVEATARRISERIRGVVSRLGRRAGQVIPLGIVDIHRVQLPEQYERLTRVLPGLLSARLNAEPRILMLERENLGTQLKEKQLTDGNDAAFWNSAVLVDGYVQPDPNGGIQISLRLCRSGGTVLKSFAVSVDPNAPVAALDKTALQISQTILKNSLSRTWDAATEAEEFYRQGVMLCSHRRFEEAIGRLETAHALRPDNMYYTAGLFDNEWRRRGYIPDHAVKANAGSDGSDLELAELASCLVRQIRRDLDGAAVSPRYVYDHWAKLLGMDMVWSGYFARPESAATEQIRGINRMNRKIWVEMMRKVLESGVVRDGNDLPMFRANLAWITSDDPNELMTNLRIVLAGLQIPPDGNKPIELSEDRVLAFDQAIIAVMSQHRKPQIAPMQVRGGPPPFMPPPRDEWFGQAHLRGRGNQLVRLLKIHMKELSEVNDPLTRFGSCVTLALIDTEGNASERAEAVGNLQRALVPFRTLVDPASPLTPWMKRVLGARVREVLVPRPSPLTAGSSEPLEALKALYGPLIDQKAVDALAWLDPGFNLRGDRRETVADYYDLLERIAQVLEPRQTQQHVAWALSHVRDWSARVQSQYPNGGWTRRPSGIAATVLFDASSGPPRLIVTYPPVKTWGPHEGVLWLASGRWANTAKRTVSSICTVAGIDLAGKKVRAQWRGEISLPQAASVAGVTALGGALYVALDGGGLLEFPEDLWHGALSRERPRLLTQKDGLPSVYATATTSDGRRLWIGYGSTVLGPGEPESGLGTFDPKTRRWETVFCSTLKGEPPFHSGRPYNIPDLLFVPPDAIYFTLYFPDFPAETKRWGGIWRLDVARRQAEHLEKSISGMPTFLGFDGGQVWCQGPYLLARFDPDTRKGVFILGQPKSMIESSGARGQGLQWRRDLFIPAEPCDELLYNAVSNAAVHGDQLWMRFGMSQIVILKRGRPFAEARVIPNDVLEGKPADRFLNTPYGLVAIGDGVIGLIETKR